MTAHKTETMEPGAARRGALIGLYLVALVAGYLLGERGRFPVHPFPQATASPLARLGVALSTEPLVLSPEGWAALRDDARAARATQPKELRPVLDLVAAVHGWETDGNPAWDEAEARCEALRWPRCDRPALDALRKRSRP